MEICCDPFNVHQVPVYVGLTTIAEAFVAKHSDHFLTPNRKICDECVKKLDELFKKVPVSLFFVSHVCITPVKFKSCQRLRIHHR